MNLMKTLQTKCSAMVLDLETSISNRGEDAVGKMAASPHHPQNKVVWFGHILIPDIWDVASKRNPDDGTVTYEALQPHMLNTCAKFLEDLPKAEVLIGHNIKFDLLYLLNNRTTREPLLDWLGDGGQIWDTMVVDYLITGQQSQFVSLDKLAAKYGGSTKDYRVKEFWDAGIETEKIPAELILPYLEEDLRNTTLVFLEQNQAVSWGHKLPILVGVQMEALLATTMMEHHGLHFNVESAADAAQKLAVKHSQLENHLKTLMQLEINRNSTPKPVDHPVLKEDCNPASNQQLSSVMLGGVFTYTRSLPLLGDGGTPVLIKSGPNKGAPKTKKCELSTHCKGLFPQALVDCLLTKNSNGYKLDEKSLKKLLAQAKRSATVNNSALDFINELLQFRSLTKELKTSYIGLLELVWPNDSCIHGNLNHTATATGRLSSSSPNQQNFSSKEIEE